MKILLINPPYQSITSNWGVGHQIPLGLLMVGGPLIDAGHSVRQLDAECLHLAMEAIVREVRQFAPDVVMTGHAGSTPAHPVCMAMLEAIKAVHPKIVTVYGGPYPTYHAGRILEQEPAVDYVIRGEGEATAVELVAALAGPWENAFTRSAAHVAHVSGIAYRDAGRVVVAPDRLPIENLDSFRVAWELIEDWDRYTCFGLGRAAIVQLSRGCPHQCTYCGQHGFWVRWRFRDPVRVADEIERLHRTKGIMFFSIADENPTTRKDVWRRFLEEMTARRLPVYFFATIRATDIVRDADILHLYRSAGLLYILMGIESTAEPVLERIRKRSTTRDDFEACQLLKRHGIFSIIDYIVGLEDETPRTFQAALRQLNLYDGDYVNVMYATPHAWTPFGQELRGRAVVQFDQEKWDYRHQVLHQTTLTPWQLFTRVKWVEVCFHLRPRRLWAILREPDRFRRRLRLWWLLHTALWALAEVFEFVFTTSFPRKPVPLGEIEDNRRTADTRARGDRLRQAV